MEYADKAKRLDGSYKFKFSYNAAKEELYVQVAEVAHEYKKVIRMTINGKHS